MKSILYYGNKMWIINVEMKRKFNIFDEDERNGLSAAIKRNIQTKES